MHRWCNRSPSEITTVTHLFKCSFLGTCTGRHFFPLPYLSADSWRNADDAWVLAVHRGGRPFWRRSAECGGYPSADLKAIHSGRRILHNPGSIGFMGFFGAFWLRQKTAPSNLGFWGSRIVLARRVAVRRFKPPCPRKSLTRFAFKRNLFVVVNLLPEVSSFPRVPMSVVKATDVTGVLRCKVAVCGGA